MKTNKTLFLFLFLSFLMCKNSIAQDKEIYYTGEEVELGFTKKKIIYVQGLGDMGTVGINFERIYTSKEGFNLSARLGGGYFNGGLALFTGNINSKNAPAIICI